MTFLKELGRVPSKKGVSPPLEKVQPPEDPDDRFLIGLTRKLKERGDRMGLPPAKVR